MYFCFPTSRVCETFCTVCCTQQIFTVSEMHFFFFFFSSSSTWKLKLKTGWLQYLYWFRAFLKWIKLSQRNVINVENIYLKSGHPHEHELCNSPGQKNLRARQVKTLMLTFNCRWLPVAHLQANQSRFHHVLPCSDVGRRWRPPISHQAWYTHTHTHTEYRLTCMKV